MEGGVGVLSIQLKVNDQLHAVQIDPAETLLHVLREKLGLTGTKEGCGEGDCGACTVLVDGLSVNACLYLAVLADGKEILTIEGLEKNGQMHEIQKAFIRHGAIQCGFCSPGMIMSVKNLLDNNPKPTEDEIRRGMSGNLCRCTGYQQMVDAIKEVSGQ